MSFTRCINNLVIKQICNNIRSHWVQITFFLKVCQIIKRGLKDETEFNGVGKSKINKSAINVNTIKLINL